MRVRKFPLSWPSLFALLLTAWTAAGCGAPAKKEKLPHPIPAVSQQPIADDRHSLIIYPPGFEESAKAFAYLHREFGGVEARLIPLGEILEGPLPDATLRRIPYAGWDSQRPEKVSIKGYDYGLARRIISFLDRQRKKDRILAVLLLGDGGLIPPSYYFHLPYITNDNIEDRPYSQWIASDLFYGSPNLDLDLEWAVGRISVDTPEQAMAVAEKYYRWHQDKIGKPPDPFIFFSGNIRKDLVYSGEILYQMLEYERIVGPHTIHYFQSDGRYTVDHLRQSFLRDPGSIHYIFTHGSGDGFEINGDYLYSGEIARMPYKMGLPLVVSPSCLDGGFDYDLIDLPHDRDGYSIGEAILRAEGAGIGYLGSSRVSLGQFHYSMSDGVVDAEGIYYRYMPGVINEFLRAWHAGTHRLADTYVEAHRGYRQRFGKFDTQDLATFVELNLLADPVLILPELPKSPKPPNFQYLTLISPHQLKQRKPYVPPEQPVTFILQAGNRSPELQATVIAANSGDILIKKEKVTPNSPLVVTPREQTSYLIRLDFPDNSVDWQFFHSGNAQEFQ